MWHSAGGGRTGIVSFGLGKADQIGYETAFDFYVIRHLPMPGSKVVLWLNRLLSHTIHSDDFQTVGYDSSILVVANRF
jgi:hypothetical protein